MPTAYVATNQNVRYRSEQKIRSSKEWEHILQKQVHDTSKLLDNTKQNEPGETLSLFC